MKKMHRLVSALLALMMLACLCVTILPVSAVNGEGFTFEAEELYKPLKKYDTTPNTYEAWIKLPSGYTERAGVILGSYYGPGPNQISFEIAAGGKPRIFWSTSGSKDTSIIFDSVNVCTSAWLHLTIVRDKAAQKFHCYVNGELKQSIVMDSVANEDVVSAYGLCFGGDLRSDNVQYFKGAIRSAALFSDVRTAEEIRADMTSPVGQDDLMVCYDVTNQATRTTVMDLSGNGYNANYVQNSTWIEPSQKPAVTDYAYSFAIVGDTQIINRKYPEKFNLIYDYISNNVEAKKIKWVFGLGDITDNDTQAEWDRAKAALHALDGKVGYSIVRGNHDSANMFNKSFPLSDYQGVIAGSYDDTMINTYQTLTVGETKYLIMTLDYGASIPVLRWAGEVCDAYPDHNVIITTHAYLYRDGTTLDQKDVCPPVTTGGYNNGDHIWEILITEHENITMVISGHDPCDQIVVTQEKGEAGNTVTQMLVDPQGADEIINGGLGMVAILYFSEDGRDVTVEYYSTIQEKYYMGVNQFTMTVDVVAARNDSDNNNDNNDNNENVNNGNDNNNNNTSNNTDNDVNQNNKPEDTKETEAVTAEATTEVNTSKDTEQIGGGEMGGGCFSLMTASAGIAMTLVLGAVLPMIRKKKD